MKRYLTNALQMTAAVTLGLMLSPVVISLRHMAGAYVRHLF